ncbi:MAG: tRNA threonylcarbamoyladenosine biosynthesis protein TsaB [Verrucomicrobiota bacterium]|jgi:tRNA threonylcarbamoyladenosine biosynthesis protein TsaB
MKTMAFELSSPQGSIALIEDDAVSFDQTFANDRKHSGLFFENLHLCLQNFDAPDAIVVGLGPGSYAGVRIAIATAVGLRSAARATLSGLPSICALEVEAREYFVIGDARRQSFFLARVRDGRVIEGPDLHTTSELESMIRDSTVPIYSSEALPQFPQSLLAFPAARKLANLACDQAGEIEDTRSLEPIYLYAPHITVPKTARMSVINK